MLPAGSPIGEMGVSESEIDTFLSYYRARYYDPTAGRFLSEDPDQRWTLDENEISLYAYVANTPTNFVDPLGLYSVKSGVPTPSPVIDALLKCIESSTGLQLFVTSTSESIKAHPAGTPHRRGVAVDIRYKSGDAGKILCAASACGAGFGLDEAKHPSPNSTGAHIHLQIPAGTKGGHGDLPKTPCTQSGCK
jgi:RHS repeat-associated protein